MQAIFFVAYIEGVCLTRASDCLGFAKHVQLTVLGVSNT